MFGSIVPFDFVGDSPRLGRLKALVKSCRGMCIEIVCNKHDAFCLRVVFVYELAEHLGKVNGCSSLGGLNASFADQRLDP